MNIFVAGLPYSIGSKELHELFETYGTIQSAKIIMDKGTGQSRCFGFVEMPEESQAQKAIETLDGKVIDDKTIAVKKSQPKT
jgi:RNA recognition motif-containing protein